MAILLANYAIAYDGNTRVGQNHANDNANEQVGQNNANNDANVEVDHLFDFDVAQNDPNIMEQLDMDTFEGATDIKVVNVAPPLSTTYQGKKQ